MTIKVRDLFAGSGWGVACQQLGWEEHGVEIMPEAQATRAAAGMKTVGGSVMRGPMRLRGSIPGAEPMTPFDVPDRPLWFVSPDRKCAPVDGKINELFTSSDQAELTAAAKLCRRCPFMAECRQWAKEQGEQHHVWGGQKRSPKRTPVQKPAPAADTPADELVTKALPTNHVYFGRLSDGQKRLVIAGGLEQGYSWAKLAQGLKVPMHALRALCGNTDPAIDLEAQVKRLYDEQCTDAQIAKTLGVSDRTVGNIRKRLNLPALYGPGRKLLSAPPGVTTEMDRFRERVRELYQQNLTDTAIAEQLGRTIGQVQYARTVLGLPARHGRGRPRRPMTHRQHTTQLKDTVRELHGEGLTDPRIADRLGIGTGSVAYVRGVLLGLPSNHRPHQPSKAGAWA